MNSVVQRLFRWAAVLLAVYAGLRYVLPLVAPFLLGLVLALAAEPVVGLFCRRFHFPRGVASGLGVGLALGLLMMAVLSLCAFAVRELGMLARILPELEEGVRSGMGALSGWLMGVADRAPAGIRDWLSAGIGEFFSGGSAMLDRVVDFLLHLASGILSRVPGGALTFVTAVISAFMISAKLPDFRATFRRRVSMEKLERFLEASRGIKSAVFAWLKAQVRLSGVTLLITTLGFFLLRIPYAPLWGALVALVDALPVLGSGAVLVPWSLVSFLQGDRFRAFALLGVYGAATLTRSVLEPRLIGRHLGLDPLVTLMALYIGYRLFGLAGMLLAPVLTVAAVQLFPANTTES